MIGKRSAARWVGSRMNPEDMFPKTDASYELPLSVTKSALWYGPVSDRLYIIRIVPPIGNPAILEGLTPADLAKRSVVSFGQTAGVWAKTGGVSKTPAEVDEWWDRIGTKAHVMITTEFMSHLVPDEDEDLSHRQSRREM